MNSYEKVNKVRVDVKDMQSTPAYRYFLSEDKSCGYTLIGQYIGNIFSSEPDKLKAIVKDAIANGGNRTCLHSMNDKEMKAVGFRVQQVLDRTKTREPLSTYVFPS
jgi:hypothetical protein